LQGIHLDLQNGSAPVIVDRNSPVPLYSQLKKVLLASIQTGRFQAGDLFPTEREICTKFQVSRITVRRAVDELAREGYLVTQQGKGTFVAQAKIRRPMTHLESFSAATVAEGHRPGSRLLSLRHEQASEPAASLLKVSPEAWLWVVERLRLADDAPIGISMVYLNLPPELSLTPAELEQEVSLWSILQTKEIVLSKSEETVQAVAASEAQANLLKVDAGFPLLLVEGLVYSDQTTPLEYHQIFNRGDRYKYSFQTVR
jgi:GntR family transcriptional regulator